MTLCGEVSLVCSAGLSSGFAFAYLAVDEGSGFVDVAVLGDAGDVEDAVDSTVAAGVEAVPDRQAGAFAGGQRDGAGAVKVPETCRDGVHAVRSVRQSVMAGCWAR